MDWLLEPLSLDFVRRGIAAGLLTVVMTSIVGTWVVLRGMSFMGDALAHGVLPGIAVAHITQTNLTLGAALSALAMVGGVNLVHRRARLAEDVGIALLFVGMLALGVAIVSRSAAYAGDVTAFLFGDPLGVTAGDIAVSAVATAVIGAATLALYRPLLVLTFSRVKARTLGLAPGVTHAALLVMMAVAIVASFRTVGTLLVFAFIVAPPATAALVARRVPVMMSAAVAFGAVGVVAGMVASYALDTAAAPTIAGLTVAEFFVVLAYRDLIRRQRTRVPA